MSKKISKEEMEQRIREKHGDKITMTNYKLSGELANFHCNVCGNDWSVEAYSVGVGRGCQKCAYIGNGLKFRHSLKEVIEYIENNNCKLLSKEYIGGKLPLDIEFECGHIGKISFESFKIGRRCLICGIKNAATKKRIPIEDVIKYIELNNCKLLSKEYINNQIPLEVQFECGHIAKIRFGVFKLGQRCYICGKKRGGAKKRLSFEEITEVLKERKLKFIQFPDGYKDKSSRIICECQYGHIENHSVASLLIGSACNECTRIYSSISQKGDKAYNWQGGISTIEEILRNEIKQWKRDSAKNCNYKCIICGKTFKDIHHLYSFSSILNDCLEELHFDRLKLATEYTQDDLFVLTNAVIKKHDSYPLGVCLCRKDHNRFHEQYGRNNNTPDQWYEFINNINLSREVHSDLPLNQ